MKVKNKLLSIIFLHWVKDNNDDLINITRKSLESIFKYTNVDYELIIVSNGSSKKCDDSLFLDTLDYINIPEYYYPKQLKFIKHEENLGVSRGFNAGLKSVSPNSNYISIFSNDWLITHNTFKNAIKVLDDNNDVGFTTSCTNWGAGSMCFDNNNPNAFEKPNVSILDNNIFEINEGFGKHQESANKIMLNNFPAMGWLMKKEVFDDVGYMDERIFCANDVAYYYRARLFGWKSVTVWNSWILHEWHSSFSQVNNKENYNYLRPKDTADIKLIQSDNYYKDINVTLNVE